jgi:hypothetical protein
MAFFHAVNNQLTSFPVHPKMKTFIAHNNQLTSFPVQPNMLHFVASNNLIMNFPRQPKMWYYNSEDIDEYNRKYDENLHIIDVDYTFPISFETYEEYINSDIHYESDDDD